MAIINSTAEPYLATDLISDNHSVSAGVAGVAVAPVRPLFFIFFAYLDYFILVLPQDRSAQWQHIAPSADVAGS